MIQGYLNWLWRKGYRWEDDAEVGTEIRLRGTEIARELSERIDAIWLTRQK